MCAVAYIIVVIPKPKANEITTTEAEDNLPSKGAEAQTEPVPM